MFKKKIERNFQIKKKNKIVLKKIVKKNSINFSKFPYGVYNN